MSVMGVYNGLARAEVNYRYVKSPSSVLQKVITLCTLTHLKYLND